MANFQGCSRENLGIFLKISSFEKESPPKLNSTKINLDEVFILNFAY